MIAAFSVKHAITVRTLIVTKIAERKARSLPVEATMDEQSSSGNLQLMSVRFQAFGFL